MQAIPREYLQMIVNAEASTNELKDLNDNLTNDVTDSVSNHNLKKKDLNPKNSLNSKLLLYDWPK